MTLPSDLADTVKLALLEDVGSGDVSADLISTNAPAKARIISREDAVLCGCAWFEEVFRQVDDTIVVSWFFSDGNKVKAEDLLCEVEGPAKSLVTAERTALNFLQLLSATATQTNTYVEKIQHTNCKLLDTRKTIPGLRTAQKYAVVCGGGKNHRIGLFDQVLIKENHIMAAGSISAAVENARRLHPAIKIEVEAETLAEVQQGLDAKADIIMLDNFDRANLIQAVHLAAGKVPLEASGGVNLETITAIAETGVDYISVGDVTKNVKAIDLSMRFV
ncbi:MULTISPECIES: carboxylating nicotinate-nucleotide diphosphorylase [Marinomonas]|uniref:nicotinate-nucleotide diphosphorylase (carboxylating) n=3 Tax=Marinomonas TaxID=28253 RepID=A0ABS5HFJ9_9GAMM|nr:MULTISPECIES: carboxylating nicotinate-nucleotide diphosphorylase [Marinomonas]MBR7890312.1 carboxylating nicotinate-nucleotide diphosphorylase [Marinomonas vulgaris]RCW98277.1 nicotinate-nucleotide pyrophosphorylase [carboxylating] [Marinomonas foliarum]SHG87123.1 nicotinate-nucleotide pyrophosphorylase [carboxylating] [Marinomonas polaris DSM 16579]|tara:strand:- start:1483 stop:2310 length:828 start_codon:yes stop_codon:yes gene_type:complete